MSSESRGFPRYFRGEVNSFYVLHQLGEHLVISYFSLRKIKKTSFGPDVLKWGPMRPLQVSCSLGRRGEGREGGGGDCEGGVVVVGRGGGRKMERGRGMKRGRGACQDRQVKQPARGNSRHECGIENTLAPPRHRGRKSYFSLVLLE